MKLIHINKKRRNTHAESHEYSFFINLKNMRFRFSLLSSSRRQLLDHFRLSVKAKDAFSFKSSSAFRSYTASSTFLYCPTTAPSTSSRFRITDKGKVRLYRYSSNACRRATGCGSVSRCDTMARI